MKEEIKKWFEQAEDDLDKVKILFKNNKFDGAVYFCEQAVEKALKSFWLKKFKKMFPYTHDLTIFAKELNLPEEFYVVCEDLSNIYPETRYPSSFSEAPFKRFHKKEVTEILNSSERLIKWIKTKI